MVQIQRRRTESPDGVTAKTRPLREANNGSVAERPKARYCLAIANRRRSKVPTQRQKLSVTCKSCDAQFRPLFNSEMKIFCSCQCHADWRWRQKKIAIEGGANVDKRALRRYLMEKHSGACTGCGIKKWRQKKITLQLHHIDGNTDNSVLANADLLCPNCHSQTETFGRRGGRRSFSLVNRRRQKWAKRSAPVNGRQTVLKTVGSERTGVRFLGTPPNQ